jgi:hypothetical protein
MMRAEFIESTVRRFHRIGTSFFRLAGEFQWGIGQLGRGGERAGDGAVFRALVALAVIVTSVFGCSDDGGTRSNSPAVPVEDSWAIHVYVDRGGRSERVDFPPVAEVSRGNRANVAVPEAGAVKPQANFNFGNTPGQLPLEDIGKKGWSPGWELVIAAGNECGVGLENPAPGRKYTENILDSWIPDDDYAWSGFFAYPPASCDEVVEREETLLCMADKLAQVADTIVPIRWEGPSRRPGGGDYRSVWTIPPQADKDKFIVRDLAISILAHLASVDQTSVAWRWAWPSPEGSGTQPEKLPPSSPETGQTCSEIYAATAASGVLSSARSMLLFGKGMNVTAGPTPAPLYPSVGNLYSNSDNLGWKFQIPVVEGVVHEGVKEVARLRLTYQAHILRASSRLLYDLIRDSVFADLAGAEQRGARAGDPGRANDIAWGLDGPYNSLAHALRVISGRWEIGNTGTLTNFTDLECGGIGALELLQKGLGPAGSARQQDKPISTNAQANAVAYVEFSGVVVPASALTGDQRPNTDTLRDLIVTQLAKHQAGVLGVSLSEFEANGGVARIQEVIKAISDGDLQFSLQRNHRSWRTLKDKGETLEGSLSGPASELQIETLALPGAFAVVGGLPRSILPHDPNAALGGALEASQCNEVGQSSELHASPGDTGVAPEADPSAGSWAVWTALGVDPAGWPQNSGQRVLPDLSKPYIRQISVFQDAFAIAQTLQRRLTMIGARLDPVSRASTHRTAEIAYEGAAELKQWAGPGRIVSYVKGGHGTALTDVHLELLGFEPKDFGIELAPGGDLAAEMAKQLSLVYGPPWLAECAIGGGIGCPTNFEENYRIRPKTGTTVESITLESAEAAKFGIVGTKVHLTYDLNRPELANAFANFTTRDDHLYVVAARDPASSAPRGKVLGTLALRSMSPKAWRYDGDLSSWTDPTDLSTTLFVSRMRDELLAGIFAGWRSTSLAESSSYCIDGVPRDLIAPLENELTSDSDGYENSWRHYLTLARQAADRADSLGQQMLEYGEKQDLRREAAGEELSDICGGGASMDAVEIDPATNAPTAGAGNATLELCLSPPKYDLVFLTKDPRLNDPETGKPMELAKARTLVRTALGCGTSYESNACKTYTEAAGNDVVFDENKISALDLADPTQQAPDASKCAALANAGTTLQGDGFSTGDFNGAIGQGWASDDELRSIASQLKFDVNDEGDWSLESSGQRLMASQLPSSSSSPPVWPGCLRAGQDCQWANNIAAETFNKAFRWCAGGDSHAALGQCGNGGGGNDERAELNTLRWRVTGALWLLGAMSGRIPGGMFHLQMLAADWESAAWDGSARRAPVPTIYGVGRFDAAGGLKDRPANETAAFSVAREIKPNFAYHGARAPYELPDWIRAAYDPVKLTRYRHLDGRNLDGVMKMGSVAEFFRTKTGVSVAGDKFDQESRKRLAGKIAGMRCTNPYGSPTKAGEWDGAELQRVFAAIKTAVASGTPLRKRFDSGEDGDALWANWFCWGGGNTLGDCGPLDDRYRDARAFADWWKAEPYSFYQNLFEEAIVRVSDWDETTWSADGYHDGIIAGGDNAATSTPRDDRVFAFANSGAPNGGCGAVSQFVQAHALGCIGALNGGAPLSEPPKNIRSEQDIAQLEQYLHDVARDGRKALSRLALENIPRRVVADIRKDTVANGGVDGQMGTNILELENELRRIPDEWNSFTNAIDEIAAELRIARNSMAGASLEAKGQDLDLESATWEAHLTIARGVSQAVAGGLGFIPVVGGGGGVSGAVKGAAEGTAMVASGINQLVTIGEKRSLNVEKLENRKEGIVLELVRNTLRLSRGMKTAMENTRTSVANVKVKSAQLSALSEKAKYLAAKGSGQDFFETESGQVTKFPVNTVLNRLYGSTEQRYKRALRDAKAMAFLARRAIEQRLGVRLESMDTPVGPLEAPARWRDDGCRLIGIDYKRLRYAPGPDAGTAQVRADINQQYLTEFTDSFIGDYVEKLANLVEYYNMEYPSHDSDDVAVLSLKDDLLGRQKACFVEAPNLLYHSGSLDALGKAGSLERGWRLSECPTGTSHCLALDSSAFLLDNQSPPSEPARGSVTWLHDRVTGLNGRGIPPPREPGPEGFVWQELTLEPGHYVASWWDQARTEDGHLLATGPSVPYRVAVFDATFVTVTGALIEPSAAGDASVAWSPRRALSFDVAIAGKYRLGFAASGAGTAGGSVAIANAQVEAVSGGSGPTSYVATDSTRQVASNDCSTSSSEELRAAFDRRCNADGCFYELRAPFSVDTLNLADRTSALNGKIAKGNFNFRHIDTALNLVGTGVRDCAGSTSPACYGTGFVEYTLTHNATQVGVVDWIGDETLFDFGFARLEHAKALSAERYMTMPLGQTDLGLLAQTGISKPELRGRPLDGVYGLRIHDSPALRWDRLQDIQFVVKYRYWSRIQKKAPAGR